MSGPPAQVQVDDAAAAALERRRKRELLKTLLQSQAARRPANLSLEQRRLFTLHLLDPASHAYNLLAAHEIAGDLDTGALRRGLAEIVRRHAVLRSAFRVRDGEPEQEALPPEAVRTAAPLIDLGGLPAARRAAAARGLALEVTRRPFDLAAGEVCRFVLLRMAAARHQLLLAYHHIVTDVRSFEIFNRELAALYAAFRRGEPSPLPPLGEQYADYCRWQRQQLDEGRLAAELAEWQRALAGLEVTEVPADLPRPAAQTHHGARELFTLPPALLAAGARLARERDLSPFMVSLGMFLVLLHRHTGAADVNCGIPVSNRDTPGAAELVGFFVNTAVARADLAGDLSFDAVLERVRAAARTVYACSHLPFDRLVEGLRQRRDARRNPLYQITFQTGLFPPLRLAGLAVENAYEQDYGIVRADLELYVGDDGRALFVYNRDLYRPATVAGLARRFRGLCEGLLADPARPVGDVAWMSAAERHAVLHEWGTGAVLPAAAPPADGEADVLAARFHRQAGAAGEAIAAVLGDAALSYGELDRRANRVAHWLRARGVGGGEPVGIRGERDLDMLVALFAVLKAGGAYLPLSPGLPAERLTAVLADSGARFVLTWGGGLAGLGDGAVRFHALGAVAAAGGPDPLPPAAAPEAARQLAYVIYTSGSTGRPKGVLIENRSPMALAVAMESLCYGGLPARGVRLSLNAPLDFDASMQQIVMLTRGHRLVVVPEEVRRDGPAFVRHLAEQGVEVLDCTPAHLAVLVDAGLLDTAHGSLRRILAAGGAIDRPLWDRLAAAGPVQAFDIYGPTEATVNATGQAIELPGSAPHIGRPLAGYSIYLLDARLHPVPPGAAGEIFIGGGGVARGYLARPQLTARSFVPDPFGGAAGARLYRSGDFARHLPDGTFEFLGRRDDQVKVRGMRVELGEIRARLLAQPAVRQAAVVTVEGEAAGSQLLAAYVVPRAPRAAGEAATPGDDARFAEAVRAELRRHCPEHMIPSRLVVLDALPLTPNGKLDRAALPPPPPESAAAAATAAGAALSEYEELLREIWAAVLGVPAAAIGAGSSFFDLGGHSLLAAEVAARLRHAFQAAAPASLVLAHPTLREQARAVGELRRTAGTGAGGAPPAAAPPPIRRAGPAVVAAGTATGTDTDTAEAAAPLSFAQERIWFLEQLDPGLTAYNVPVFLRLAGGLDVAALAAAWRRLVARHAALRTVFELAGGQPAQRAVDPGPAAAAAAAADSASGAALPLVELGGLAAADGERAVQAAAREVASLRLGLAEHPLFRLALLRLAADRHVLLLCLQHIVADAWSIRILLDELGVLYAAARAGSAPALPPIALSPADHARWQRQTLTAAVLAEQLRFWRAELDVAPPPLNLPADHPRPAVFRYRGANVPVELGGDELGRVVRAAAREGVTLFMLLTAALQLLLARTCGEEDVWIGAPVANRPHAELGGLVGMLINLLVLRGRLPRRQSVRQLLAATRRAVLDAWDHQEAPFEKVVEALNPDRSLSHNPLFQCMFSYFSGPESPLDLTDVEATRLFVENGTAKLDLTFDLGYTGERLVGRLEYNSDLFDRATALRLAGAFRVLVGELAAAGGAAGERALGDLALLTAGERFQLVHEWNDTARERRDDVCIHQLFERQAGAAPERVAVVCGASRLSYGELDRRAARLAGVLLGRCRSPRARIGVYLPRCAEMATALLAVLKAGMTYVPLDAGYPRERIARILESSGAELVLTHATLAAHLAEAAPEVAAVCVAGAAADAASAGSANAAAAAAAATAASAAATAAPRWPPAPDDLAYVIFTSGSTGRPKGVVLQHRPVVNLIDWVNRRFAVGPGDTLLFITSLCFDLSVYDVFGTLAAGATLHVADDAEVRDPEALVELLLDRVTLWDSAPAALAQLQPVFDAERERGRSRGSGLRLVLLSGDWIPLGLAPAVTAAFPRARVIGLGGATEAAIWSNSFAIGEIDPEWRSIPYGRPIQNARYQVLDEGWEPCPINVVGDLYIGGGCLSLGYLDEPLLTARQYLPDAASATPGGVLYATGDRARLRPDGNIEFLGRVDSQVKIRGFRIELGEIEAVLEGHPGVAKAVALARADRPGAKRLVAYVQPRPGGAPAPAELADWMRAQLPEYMIPAHLVWVDAWPVTPNGKLDRKALPAPEAAAAAGPGGQDLGAAGGGGGGAADGAPASLEQAILLRIWAEVLGLDSVGVDDNFFALGGDSIVAIQIVARANQEGLRLRARDFFRAQTVAAMLPAVAGGAAALAGGGAGAGALAGAAARAAREAVHEAPLTPIQRWFFDQRLAAPEHFNQAVLLEWKGALEVPRLRAALGRLCAGHDALRLRFAADANGEWRQTVRPAAAGELYAWRRIDLAGLAGEVAAAALVEGASEVQATLRLADGPLVAACLFDGAPQRLLLVVHHLAIDGVSWRFLLDDLLRFYGADAGVAAGGDAGPLAGRPIAAAAAAAAGSWLRWADRAGRGAAAARFRGEEEFWLRQGRAAELPSDLAAGDNLAGSAATVTAGLTREETELLERRVPAVYRTGIMDVLLTALVRTLGADATGGAGEAGGRAATVLSVDLEGHGRHPELAGATGGGNDAHDAIGTGDVDAEDDAAADLARTVGWFTSLYPLTLTLDAAAGPGAQLKAVKEQLRAVPHEGVGYGVLRYLGGEAGVRLAACPRPQILVNHLGRFDGALADNPHFRLRTDLTGADVGPANRRTHLFEITSLVADGVFETRWRFSRHRHRPATVERLVERFLAALRWLIAHCLEPHAGGRTPADFPLAAIGQPALDALYAADPGLADLYPATPMQHGMLFHGELAAGAGIYHQQVALDVAGDLDVAALRAAWAAAISRHAILRTRFVVAAGRYLQAVTAEHPGFWTAHDLSALPPAAAAARLDELGRDDLARAFDLSREVPFRVVLARLAADRHHLLVSFHHALLDGWSLAVLFEEVSELYQAAREGRAPIVAATAPLADHVAWLAGRDAASARAFWRRSLAGFQKPNPLARPGWAGRPDAGVRTARRALPGELLRRLDRYARGRGLTRGTLFQAAWALLVGRYSDAADVVVGVTSSGREQGLPGIDRMVGLFINTLPLRVAVDERAPVGEWLDAVQRELVAVRELDHSSLAEVQAASELGPGQALFESIVVIENYPWSEARMASWLGHRISGVRTWERASYPLTLLVELRAEITLGVSCEARCFEAVEVQRLLAHLETLLGTIAAAPTGATLADLDLLSAGERHQLLVEHNDMARAGAPGGCLHDLVARQAAATPERIAAVAADGWLSYGALAARGAGLARWLVRQGVVPGDRVALWVERSVEAIAAILAVSRAGGAYVPIDLELPADRAAFILADSGARLALTGGGRAAADAGAALATAEALATAGAAAGVLATAGAPAAPRVVAMPAPGAPAIAAAANVALPRVDAAQPAYLIYTSGSTGRPKGVVVAHASVANLLLGMHELVYSDLDLGPGAEAGAGGGGLRVSLNAPLAFDASVQQIAMLGRGHTLHLVPAAVRQDGAAFVDFLAAQQIEGLDITPTHLGLLLAAGLLARADLALCRVAVAGGHIDQAMWDRLAVPPRRFFDIYGPTEATVNACGRPIDAVGGVPTIGRPLVNYRLLVLDRRLRPAPTGVAGELFLGGPGLALGYHARPDLTAERFLPDPFAAAPGERLYRTGDLVRRRDDGEVEFLGRGDQQVKLRGFRVELGEIESVLRDSPRLAVVAVVVGGWRPAAGAAAGGEGAGGGLGTAAEAGMLLAYYTTHDGGALAPGELRALARRRLPDYMIPGDFVHLERLPLQANGKVARDELAKLGAGHGRERVAPRNPTEERVVRLWAEVLGVPAGEISVDHDFLSLGGHSLNAVALAARLAAELGAEVSLRALYEGETIAGLAAEIARHEEALLGSARAAELLAELERLSPEEIRALIEQESR